MPSYPLRGTARWRWPQLLLASLFVVGIYVAMRFISDGLDLPAGYATPVFLPAGAGFALAVTIGWRILPAIALGAGLLHLPGAWLGPDATPSAGAMMLVVTTAGSVLQAWLGARWFRRLARSALDSARDVGRFLMLAPLTCLVNATMSVSALHWLGLISAAERWPNWVNWWAGDTVGVLLVAPLVWIICGRPRPLWRRRARAGRPAPVPGCRRRGGGLRAGRQVGNRAAPAALPPQGPAGGRRPAGRAERARTLRRHLCPHPRRRRKIHGARQVPAHRQGLCGRAPRHRRPQLDGAGDERRAPRLRGLGARRGRSRLSPA
jgi:hypothetical protein